MLLVLCEDFCFFVPLGSRSQLLGVACADVIDGCDTFLV